MRSLFPGLCVAGAVCLPLQALAFTAQTNADCIADLAAVNDTVAAMQPGAADLQPVTLLDLLPADKHPVFEGGFCVVKDIKFPQSPSGRFAPQYFATALRWQAEWQDDTRPMPPDRLVIDLHKAGNLFGASVEDADQFSTMLAYQTKLMSDLTPNDFRLELAYDRQTDRLEIVQLAAQNGYWNRIEMTGAVSGVDLDGVLQADRATAVPIDRLVAATVEKAEVTATNHGLFEMMSMPWLQAIYPKLGPTPEAAVAAAKDMAKGQIALAPEALLPSASKTALTALIDAVPHPSGTLTLRLDAPEGIMPSRIVATAVLVEKPSWESFAAMYEGASIDVEWTPSDWPPPYLPPLIAD